MREKNAQRWQADERHRETKKARFRFWYEQNRERNLLSTRRWRQENIERARANARRWYRENRERSRANARKWMDANPHKRQEYNNNRRSRTLGAQGASSNAQIADRFAYHGCRCIYCGSEDRLTIEHLIPLSRGGSNWPANLAPSCKFCNSSKGTKTHFEYLAWLAERERQWRHPAQGQAGA